MSKVRVINSTRLFLSEDVRSVYVGEEFEMPSAEASELLSRGDGEIVEDEALLDAPASSDAGDESPVTKKSAKAAAKAKE